MSTIHIQWLRRFCQHTIGISQRFAQIVFPKFITLYLFLKNPFPPKKNYRFYNDEETLELLLKNKSKGFVRFGNSELAFLAGHSIKHQSFNFKLRELLVRILTSPDPSYWIGFPIDTTLEQDSCQRPFSREVWGFTVCFVAKHFVNSFEYLSPFIFRVKDVDVSDFTSYTAKLETLFENRKIVYVGPNRGKNAEVWEGFDICERIELEEREAFKDFEGSLEAILEKTQGILNPLVLIVGGITATVLSAELNTRGIVTYDLGQFSRHWKETR